MAVSRICFSWFDCRNFCFVRFLSFTVHAVFIVLSVRGIYLRIKLYIMFICIVQVSTCNAVLWLVGSSVSVSKHQFPALDKSVLLESTEIISFTDNC